VRWAVVGTRALEPGFVADVCGRFPGRVIAAVDARDGRVAVRGWVDRADVTPLELAQRLRHHALAALLYTDVGRDGTERGPNVEATAALARHAGLPVLASGGVGRVADVAALAAVADAGIEGVVIGRALYTGAITLRDAMNAAAALPRAPGAGEPRSAPASRPPGR
jgi:phosphoribosylformimino-5-aminoimidazole carboxamide ribotide isomerase